MKHKILVVDDEPEIVTSLKEHLTEHGFDVATAGSAEEFRKRICSQKPDLIVLDIKLGTRDGAEVYEKLLKDGFDRTVPVIFISGLAHGRPDSPASPGRKYALHSKPFDLDAIVKDINCLVGE